MKKLIFKLLLFLPILIFMMIFNYVVDPARLFKTKDFEKKVAEALISGAAVTDLQNTNFDDRALQKFRILSLKARKDIGVLGSSRVGLISSDMFPDKTLLNNTLSEASLEDYISLYEIYRDRRVVPSIMIIGVDPWIFNKNNELFKWHKLEEYYLKFFNALPNHLFNFKIRPQEIIPYEYQQMVSISYFQSGIQFLRSHPVSKQEFSLTDRKWNESVTLLPDGSTTSSRKEREAALVQVRQLVQREDMEPRDLVRFFKLDPDLKQKFIEFIRAMQDQGVRVVLFLPPYHPLAYDYCVHSDRFKIIMDVEDFLRNTSHMYSLTLVGSYNPRQLSIPESSFSDSLHLRNNTELKRIFPKL
jgi:hypothetical protein